jgi:hypothetical protein
MDALINERVAAPVGFVRTKGSARIELVPAQVRDLLNLRRLPARLNVQQAAALLNCGEHDIPVLVSNGLLKPLGHPPLNAVKYFAPTDVLELAGDSERMGQICDTLYEYWRGKNAAKSDGTHAKRARANGATVPQRAKNGTATRHAE